MVKVGAVTIGQSPREDVVQDLLPLMGEQVELIQAGALDELTREEVQAFAPGPEDYALISRLRDGSSVMLAERHILSLLQQCIERLEEQGAELILFLCTGDFPVVFHSKVPLIFPCKVLDGLVPALAGRGKIAVVVPTPQQVNQSEKKWRQYVQECIVVPASPYGSQEDLDAAARTVSELDVDLVVMDCIGYHTGMKERFRKLSGKRVILSRTLAVRAMMELLS
ncbi:AroM family protein [Oscillibacter ruminantium]